MEVHFQMPYEVVKEPEWKITKVKSACYKYWFDGKECTELHMKKIWKVN